jgi:hypothetical protein
MKVNYLSILFGCFLLFSCFNKQEEPFDLIQKEKMIDVISQIEITQALVKLKFRKDTVKAQELYKQVFNSFDISKEQFNTSLLFYCKTPIQMDSIYIKAIAILESKQKELNNPKK